MKKSITTKILGIYVCSLLVSFSLGGMYEGACLDVSNLRKAKCIGTNFKRTSFKEANLTGADLRGANFEGANLTRANLSDCIINTTPCTIGGFELPPTNFKNAIITDIILNNLSQEVVTMIKLAARN